MSGTALSGPGLPRAGSRPHWIGGAAVVGAGERIEVVDPATGEVVGDVPSGTPADVDRAVSGVTSLGLSTTVQPANSAAALFAELTAEVGLPAGVFNVVHGTGPVVGEAIAAHPGVDMVSFTGSTRAGKRVAVVAADTVKRVALELGGKSANVILDDADLTKAAKLGIANAWINGG